MHFYQKLHFFLLFVSYTTTCTAQNEGFKGVVYEKDTKNTLAFVSVIIKETNAGTLTDIDGKFSFIKYPPKFTLICSNVGYKKREVFFNKISEPIVIELEKESNNLETVIVSNTENPAHRIIRLLIKNKKNNNPALLSSFKYNAYTITTIGLGVSFFTPKKIDSTVIQKPKLKKEKKEKPLTENNKKRDSISANFIKQTRENYSMVTESYTERKFKFPNRNIETVLATKVSGFKNAPFALTAATFQPFGFYNDFFQIGIDKYISPVINGSLSFYSFKLVERIIKNADTTFIIQFKPKKDKNFNGLKGLLYINSNGYAIENVIASQATEKGSALQFKIQQQYKIVNSQWFPQQLNTTITQVTLDSGAVLAKWESRSYITNVSIGDKFASSVFADVNQLYEKNAGKKFDTIWKNYRPDSLTLKQIRTYEIYDSLPKKTLNSINNVNKLVTTLALNAFQIGKLDIPFKYFTTVNAYEGFRLGLGVQTNNLLSKNVSVGAFSGYGIKDKAWKYGGNIFFTLKERTATTLTFSYQKNLIESGSVDYFTKSNNVLFSQTLRKVMAERMDSIAQFKIECSTKLLPNLQANIWAAKEKRNPAQYQYNFVKEGTIANIRNFTSTEISLGLRYVRGESFTRIGRAKIKSKLPTTQILIQATNALDNVLGSNISYTKTAVEFFHTINSKWLGTTFLQIDAGKIWGNVPYPYLFNAKASIGSRNKFVYVPNTFQTVGLYEFASSQFANIFIQHDFGNLLFKPKNLLFRPSFLLVQGIGFGNINNKSSHKNITFSTPVNGLFESGLLIKNVLRKKVNNLYYVGLGGGIFYRYGYYRLSKSNNNIAFKLGINLSLN